jgi:hypothetical protein
VSSGAESRAAYDALVVGSGAGGSAAAYRLAIAGWRIAIVEKGRELPRDRSTLDVDKVVFQGVFKSKERWRDGEGNEFAPEEYFNVQRLEQMHCILNTSISEKGQDDALRRTACAEGDLALTTQCCHTAKQVDRMKPDIFIGAMATAQTRREQAVLNSARATGVHQNVGGIDSTALACKACSATAYSSLQRTDPPCAVVPELAEGVSQIGARLRR